MTNLDKIATHPLQTSFWAEFRKAWGNEVLFTKHGLITLHKVPFTKYKIATFEKGPAPTRSMLEDLKKLAKEKHLIFIKLEPNVPVFNHVTKNKLTKLLVKAGCIHGRRLFTPTTFWIDLTRPEEDIFKKFSSKTRLVNFSTKETRLHTHPFPLLHGSEPG